MNNDNHARAYQNFTDNFDFTINRILSLYERMHETHTNILRSSIELQRNQQRDEHMQNQNRRTHVSTTRDTLIPPQVNYNTYSNNISRRPRYVRRNNNLMSRLRQNNGLLNVNRTTRSRAVPFTFFNRRNGIVSQNSNIPHYHNQFQTFNNSLSPVNVIPSEEQITNATERVMYRDLNTLQSSCPIDLLPFQENEEIIRIRQCGHIFRTGNLMRWFQQNTRCPLCRYDIRNFTVNTNDTVIQDNEGKEEEHAATQDVNITTSSGVNVTNIELNTNLDGNSIHEITPLNNAMSNTTSNTTSNNTNNDSNTSGIQISQADIEETRRQVSQLITDTLHNVFTSIDDLSLNNITMDYRIFDVNT